MAGYSAIISERKPAYGWGLRCLLEEEVGVLTVYAATCIEEASHVAARDPTVKLLVIDLAIEGMRFTEGLRRLRERRPEIFVVILAEPGETARAEEAYATVGDYFLPANAPLSEMLKGFRRAIAAEPAPPLVITEPLAAPQIAMSRRQAEVIHLVAAGNSNKHVARVLNVAEGTVKAHVAAAYRKLGVTNRTAACRALLNVSIVTE